MRGRLEVGGSRLEGRGWRVEVGGSRLEEVAQGSKGSGGASVSAESSRLWTLTPSSRTGRVAASVRSSSVTARCAMSSPIACCRRGVAARHGGEVRVADLDRHRAAEQLAPREPLPRRRAPSRRSPAGFVESVRSSANVFSLPDDFVSRFGSTGRSSMPSASRRSHSARLPTASRAPTRPRCARRPAARCRARAAAAPSPGRRPTARRRAAPAGTARRARARSR